MKKFKSVLSVICSIAIICASVIPIYAASQSPYEFLRNCGYSEEFLNLMSDEMLIKMRNEIGDYEVAEIQEETYYLTEKGAISTLGTISEDSLKITTVATQLLKKGTNQIGGCLYTAGWEWLSKKPTIRSKDAIAVNWSAEYFYQSSFLAQDFGKMESFNEDTVINEYKSPAESNQGGIGHYTKLSLTYRYVGGGMILVLTPTQPLYSGSQNGMVINFNYVHNKNPLGTGLNLTKGPVGVSINSNLTTDSLSKSIAFRFNV